MTLKDNKQIVFGEERITKIMAMEDKLQDLLDQNLIISKDNIKDLGRSLKEYLSSKESNPYNRILPFIKQIDIRGPFEVLKNGVILVDVPGNGNINESRCQIAKNVLDITDHIWIISDIKRAKVEENAANILTETLRDQVTFRNYLNKIFNIYIYTY